MMFLHNFLELFLASAPWLLLGLLIAGLIKQWVPMSWMEKQLGGNGVGTTIKAALLGAPLPLCSCGVIPAALAPRKAPVLAEHHELLSPALVYGSGILLAVLMSRVFWQKYAPKLKAVAA